MTRYSIRREIASHAGNLVQLNSGAVVLELAEVIDLDDVFERFSRLKHCLFFDSAQRESTLGRYSFLTGDPFEFIEGLADGPDLLSRLGDRLTKFTAEQIPGLPPFQGGAAGLVGYDLNRSLERLPRPRYDEFQVPALAMGLYDVVLAIDHRTNQAWLISQGFPEQEPGARGIRARARLEQFCRWLDDRPPRGEPPQPTELTARESLAPQYSVPGPTGLTSNFTREGYLSAVATVRDAIHAGEAFQINLSQRLLLPATGSAAHVFQRLRRTNPAPFAGYFDLGAWQIASASPERFLQVSSGNVETRPIKGTRPRSADPLLDRKSAAELCASEKDRAENVMIVDLLRNDLSRVCREDSVQVSQLCALESYRDVHHLVSVVRGTLAEGASPVDLLRATFPGGSVTGAPKVRAMQMIAELESTARGAYCGSLAYIGFDGAMDSSILIRSITAAGGYWQFSVGGGIVAASEPEMEYEETWHKAAGLLRALT